MLSNYLKLAWRNLRKSRSYTLINILGLSSGIACAILIFTLVSYQLSFDTFHPHTDRVYRVVSQFHNGNTEYQPGTPHPLGQDFENDYDYAEAAARVMAYNRALISLPAEKEVKRFDEENGVAFADPAFFDIFHFPLVKGSASLSEPNTALITQQLAEKYFGNEDPIGKTIRYNNEHDFRVAGILKNIPGNTDRRQEIYLSYINLRDQSDWHASDSSWETVRSGMQFFVRLKPGIAPALVNRQLAALRKKYDPEGTEDEFLLQPLGDIHFDARYDGSVNKHYLWVLSIIGLFLIVTACVNFVNLATAKALTRAREVGVRKVMGSLRRQLFWQFIFETAMLVCCSFLIAAGLAIALLPALNNLLATRMSIVLFASPISLVFCGLLMVAVIFLAGAYPGLVLSGFKPITALKGKLTQKHVGGFSLRRVLVVTQFTISQMLIIGMIVIAGQLHYSETTDLGFNKDGIVLLPLPRNDRVKMHTLQSRLSAVTGTEQLTLCSQPPAAASNRMTSFRFENRPKEEPWEANLKYGDDAYLSTYGLHLVAGRNIFPGDTTQEVLVNETCVRQLQLLSPDAAIGRQLTFDEGSGGWSGRIVGVVKDFHNYSLHKAIDPIVILPRTTEYQFCAARINLSDMRPVLAAYEKIWNDTYPQYVYSYHFLDERIARFYKQDSITLRLVEIFSAIAILIGCLGLYGLVSFMALQKTKEIGVRKVLGANIGSILWLFGREFTRLLLLAFVIAAPIAGYVMHEWLQDFQYRIPLSWPVFGLAIGSTLLVALLTVAGQSVKAAFANPVTALRSE